MRAPTITLPTERVDERDTMFARMERKPGTPAYEDYYGRRADLRKGDDRVRRMPPLCEPGGTHHDPESCGEALEWFSRIADIEVPDDLVAEWARRIERSTRPTSVLEEMALAEGAVAAGFAAVPPELVYSHAGRFDEDYGRPVEPGHGWAIVFLVEMRMAAMRHAPYAACVRESAHQYYRAAVIAKRMEAVLRSIGHAARAQYDAHYDVVLPPLAVLAGLGELGRNNILIANRHGSRVRIGAVTTSFPLEPDEPVSLGAHRFCLGCRKCSDNCPSRALSSDPPVPIRGVTRWPTDVERCYGYWRRVGTDCGICMACCPFSHPDNWFHASVRFAVRRLPALDRLLLWLDDVFYGREWRPASARRSSPPGYSPTDTRTTSR